MPVEDVGWINMPSRFQFQNSGESRIPFYFLYVRLSWALCYVKQFDGEVLRIDTIKHHLEDAHQRAKDEEADLLAQADKGVVSLF